MKQLVSTNSETDISSPKKQKGKPVKSEAKKNSNSLNKVTFCVHSSNHFRN